MDKKQISNGKKVVAYRYGNSLEVTYVDSGPPVMKKIDRDHMVNRLTGEVVEINHASGRNDVKNRDSLRKTFKRLKRLIGTNFHGGKSELWVTLTYRWADYSETGKKEPMTDPKRLFHDFRLFMRKLKRKLGKYIAYIVVIEPQGSGSLHAHLLLKTLDHSRLYVSNCDMAKLWGQGFVNVRRLKQSDNVASYLMAYLTDLDMNNLDGNFDSKKKKSIIKGARLGLYPMHFQIYRRSKKGIKNPTKIRAELGKIKDKYNIGDDKPDYYKSFEIKSGSRNVNVETEYYDLRSPELKAKIEKIKNESK